MQPRGRRYFANGITGLAVSIDTVRAASKCDGKSFPYALIIDVSNGESNFISPAAQNSSLVPPGQAATRNLPSTQLRASSN